MDRILVVGVSGSGKTTTATRLAATLGVPRLEMDAVAHRGTFGGTPVDEFRAEVGEFATRDRWVIDGNYTSWGAREAVWPRADTVVWCDLPRRIVMRRVTGRTIRRAVTREELWNGIREPMTNFYRWDPERNIIRWAWTNYDHVREKYEAAIADGSWAHADVHRLTTPAAVEAFIGSAAPDSGGARASS